MGRVGDFMPTVLIVALFRSDVEREMDEQVYLGLKCICIFCDHGFSALSDGEDSTMTSADNLNALKRCYELWNDTKGESVDAWLDLFDDTVDFRSLAMAQDPSVDFTKPCCSKAEVIQYLTGLKADWSMEHYTIDEYVVDGDRICAYGSTAWTNKRTGKSIDTPKLDFVKFKDGKIVFFYEFYDTAGLISAACA